MRFETVTCRGRFVAAIGLSTPEHGLEEENKPCQKLPDEGPRVALSWKDGSSTREHEDRLSPDVFTLCFTSALLKSRVVKVCIAKQICPQPSDTATQHLQLLFASLSYLEVSSQSTFVSISCGMEWACRSKDQRRRRSDVSSSTSSTQIRSWYVTPFLTPFFSLLAVPRFLLSPCFLVL